MTTIHEIAPGQVIDLSTQVVGINRQTRHAVLVDQEPRRAPRRIDGLTIGSPLITTDAPHDGEVHPDGDELLYLLDGAMNLRLEYREGEVNVELRAGDAIVVPRGIWHKLTLHEPGRLLHITPGPNGEARPLAATPDRPGRHDPGR